MLVVALTNVGPAPSWTKGATTISAHENGPHPDIPSGTPIATFESNGKYPATTGTMNAARLDGGTDDRSHAAIFLNYISNPDGEKIGMKILSQSKGVPAEVESKYFIGTGENNTTGYNYSTIDN